MTGMTWLTGMPVRRLLVVLGVAALGYGLWEAVLVAPSATKPLIAGLWLAGTLAVHDGVLAPIAVVVGLLLVRLLAPASRRVIAAGLFVAACLVAITLPALLTPGVAGNPSATPRDYPRGLAVGLAVVVLVTGLATGLGLVLGPGSARRRGGRRPSP